MNERENVIEVTGLRRRYGPAGPDGFEAVRGMDFTVRRGEVFALLGTNGAGKTSTVELLEGLAAPTDGRIRVLGHDPYRERALVRPRIGIMLQEGGFPSDLTVTETARMWAGCTTGARPVGEALEMVGLEHRAKVRVKQLSGGERRRLDLAMALVGRPEILFLDEPTTGLDPEARQRTRELVRALRAGGTTVVLTTHYLEEAETLADRLAIMRAGRIVLAGTPDEVRAAQPSRIRFTLPAGLDAGELPAGIGEVVPDPTDPRTVEVRSRSLQRDLTDLLLWARERDVELTGLDARSASLEEAFLRIAESDAGAGEAGATHAEPVGAGA
ncbi:ABC transporter ATP-binding protein [Streptomyces calidiresistens]|uniref:ATP-binding cassette domain-containing protein n=1 Tax=Streptomyces calidiresistens TaxID=1485586 RepID=A0A7W3T049_9ACTN|nr:ABC transporter ATP-binding protein [Streptomyces calidiresistens]MBB0228477.1 ATP-binding cassette domain-containing protein [Streptomyces calidiresistens]